MLRLEQLFEKTHQMPTIPKVVQELIDSFNQDDIEVDVIAKKVALDQVLTAKVLRLANSSYYGLQRQIGSVDEAIVVMGFNSLRTLVVATGVTGAFAMLPDFDRVRFWRHSMLVAAYSRWLAKKARQHADFAFTAGLMHGIGQVLLHLALPRESKEIDAAVAQGGHRISIEKAALGFSNNEVGAELARRWNFPEPIQAAIQNSDAPLEQEPVHPLAALVHCAIYLTDAQLDGMPLASLSDGFPRDVAATLRLDVDAVLAELPPIAEIGAGLDAFITG